MTDICFGFRLMRVFEIAFVNVLVVEKVPRFDDVSCLDLFS